MVTEISGGLVVRDKKLLMVEEQGAWNVPSGTREPGELSADTAVRVVEGITGCSSRVSRYRQRLKTSFVTDSGEMTWQPYLVDIEGEPKKGEWVPLRELSSRELASPLEKIRDRLRKRL